MAMCSAPEEKGSLIFRFYQRFANGESQIIKQLSPSLNSSETTLVLRPVGDRLLYCEYEINLVSGPRRSNRSMEISVLVKGDSIKSPPVWRRRKNGHLTHYSASALQDFRSLPSWMCCRLQTCMRATSWRWFAKWWVRYRTSRSTWQWARRSSSRHPSASVTDLLRTWSTPGSWRAKQCGETCRRKPIKPSKSKASTLLFHSFLKSLFPRVVLPPEQFIANVLENDCGCPAPAELFSKPKLTVQPTDIFNGDTFKFACSISIYVPERINKATVKYFYYKDNVNVTSSQTYISVAHPSKNGNYTCKVQAQSQKHSFVKESQIIVLNTKGEPDMVVLIVTMLAFEARQR